MDKNNNRCNVFYPPITKYSFRYFIEVVLLVLFLFVGISIPAMVYAEDPLVVAYRLDSEPVQFRNQKGEAAGILIDLWRLWSKKSGKAVRFVGDYSKATQDMIRDGRADVMAGLFKSEKRAAFLDFSEPSFSSHYYAYYHSDGKSIKAPDELISLRVGVTKDSFHQHWMQKNYPQAQLVLFDGYQGLFEAADRKEIDVFITQPRYLQRFQVKQTNSEKYKHLTLPLYTRAYRAAVKKGNKKLLQTINTYFERISTDEHNKIKEKWLQQSEANQKNKIILSQLERDWLKKHHVIRFTGDPNWLPFEAFTEDGEYVGFVSSILNLLSVRADLNIQHIPSQNWEDALRMVTEGEVDLISGDLADETIRKVSDFTAPYVEYPLAIAMRKDQSEFIPDLQDIAHKKIAMIKGYGYTWEVIKKYPDIKFIEVDDVQEGLSSLATGEIDAFVSTFALSSYHINQMGLQSLRIVGQIPITMKLGLAVRKDWTVLLGILNKAINSISSDEKHQIINQWMQEKYIERVDYSLVLQVIAVGGAFFLLVLFWGLSIRRQKERLRISEDRFHLAMGAASEGIWDWNIETNEVYYSPGYHAMLGFEVGELHSDHKAWEDMLHPADKIAAINAANEAIANREKSYVHEFRLRTKQGDYRFIRSIGSVVEQSAQGKSVRAVGSQIDITEQKLAEEKLLTSEAQLKAIIDAVPVSIFIADSGGKIQAANPYAVSETQSEATGLIGRTIQSFCIDKEGRNVIAELARSNDAGKVSMRFKTDVGNLIDGLISVIRIVYDGKPAFLGLWVNLTERMQMERDLAEAKQSAEEANQFKSRFLANMSHEIRTPMNAIIGLSHLALQTNLDERQRDYLEKVQTASQTLLGVINDILDFSRIEAGRLYIESVPFHLDEILGNLSDLVTLRAEEKGLEILFDVDPNVPQDLTGDPTRITQILINLTQNAIKFTEQGHVVIRITVLSQDAEQAEYCFEVVDTGIGIEPEKLPQLFESFAQADSSTTRQYGGSGLGLAICKQLTELMHGSINAESKPGKGSRFSFTLPLLKQAEKPLVKRNLVADDVRVLVVDDNPVASNILSEMLESFRFKVKAVGSAFAALDELSIVNTKAEGPYYNLVLMDWKMPGMNGLEAIEHIRALSNLKEMPALILITAHNRTDVILQAEKARLDGFLLKPASPSMLFDSVSQALSKDKQPVSGGQLDDNVIVPLQGDVLLIEDNSINRLVAREILENMGLVIFDAESGEQALESLQERSFDLVLMDIQMPGMDGYETTRRIRLNPSWKDLPVVAMTAHAMAGDRQRCLDAGMNEHIPKPIDPEHVYQLLSIWLTSDSQQSVEASHAVSMTTQLPANLPGMDIHWGLNRIGGNQELYIRLLKSLFNDHSDKMEELKGMLDRQDIENARRLTHTLHGVAANLGARELATASENMGASLQSGYVANSDQLFQQMESKFLQVMTGLKVWLGNTVEELNNENELMSDDEGVELMALFTRQLKEGDPSVKDLLVKLDVQLNTSMGSSRLTEMKQLIDQYEFDAAYELYKKSIE